MSRREELSAAIEQAKNLINAPTCYPPLKEIAQKWIDSIDTPEECEIAYAFIREVKEDIRPIDNLIEFSTSAEGKAHFGEESAKALAEHAVDIKINGGKYCDCSACSACSEILKYQEQILGEELCKKMFMTEGLQVIVTALSQQADGHLIQSRIFASQGFEKLAKKYEEHAEEERGYVVRCIDRLMDLGVEVKLEDKKSAPICKDAEEFLKYDLQVSKDGLKWLAEVVKAAQCDLSTFEILAEYYKDEEKDMYENEQQLELIEMIGKQNWLAKQI